MCHRTLRPWHIVVKPPAASDRLLFRLRDEKLEQVAPATLAAHTLTQRFAARSIPIEAAVLEIDASRAAVKSGKRDLDLARALDVRLEFPLRRDLPGHDEPPRRIPDEDRAPRIVDAVHAVAVAAAADAALDHRSLERRRADVVTL